MSARLLTHSDSFNDDAPGKFYILNIDHLLLEASGNTPCSWTNSVAKAVKFDRLSYAIIVCHKVNGSMVVKDFETDNPIIVYVGPAGLGIA